MTVVAATRSGGGVFGATTQAVALASDVADFDCTGWADCTEVFLASSTAITITGFFAVPGRRTLCRLVTNTGLCPITLQAEGAASLAENRIAGTTITLPPDAAATLVYDYAVQRWRVACHTGVAVAARAARAGLHFFTDFLSGATAIPELTYAGGNGGTIGGQLRAGALGSMRMLTDTTTAFSFYSALGTSMLRFSLQAARIGIRVQIAALQTAADHVALRFGFLDTTAAAPVDGAYFEYDTSASANWRICTADASARTQVATAIAVSTAGWYQLEVAVNAAGTAAEFFINGVLVGTITTNIPTASLNSTTYGFHVVRLAGTPSAAYGFYVDSLGLDLDIAPSR